MSRSYLDRESQQSRLSWHFEKWHLDKSQQSLCYKVLICLHFYLCLDWVLNFDTLKKDILTVEKVSRLWKGHLDRSRNLELDLDWSWQSRPPGLLKMLINWVHLVHKWQGKLGKNFLLISRTFSSKNGLIVYYRSLKNVFQNMWKPFYLITDNVIFG